MKTLVIFFALIFSMSTIARDYQDIEILKQDIVSIAKKYEGLGDPDLKIQNELEPMVKKLLALRPQASVADRLPLLFGVWKQVWGPYEYRKNNRGVDPTISPKEIYQVISPEGFYYNVSPNLDKKTRKEKNINYLRGKYTLSKTDPVGLDVKFTKFIGMNKRPLDRAIYDFVDEAERDQLPNQITVVPRWIVKLAFGGGTLREVYTDENLRILYGSNDDEFKNQYLYIMTRVE